MSLMTKSTTYAELEKKYRDFGAPTFRVFIEGVDIGEKLGTRINYVEVELTSEYPASGASFLIIDEYVYKDTNFDSSGVYSKLDLGAKVEIELGYIVTEKVFCGLITEISYIFDADDAPAIRVSCMDAKCLLMKAQRLEIRQEKKLSQVISDLLKGQPISAYLDSSKIEIPGEAEEPLSISMQSDYDFITRQAQYSGCEFFIFCKTAYFRKRPASDQPILTISPGAGILEATLSLRGDELVGEIQVSGIDPAGDKEVTATAKVPGKFGDGAGPNRMLSGSKRVYMDSRIRSEAQAKARADGLAGGVSQKFGLLECSCVGLPELVPGRTVQCKGLFKRADTSFYITSVRHRIDTVDGYTTSLEARIDSL